MSTTTFLQLDYSATYGDQPSGYSAAWFLNTYNDEPDIEIDLGRSATDALQNAGHDVPEFA